MKATLLWIDLEMTGLNPEKDKILEVAAIGTDWDLNPICEYTGIVKVDPEFMKSRMVGKFWDKNSESRDALIAQNESGKPINVIESELIDFLDNNFAKQSIKDDPKGKNKIILAGNSIHQDRKFIEREMPELNERLHYRMLDVSAWKVYFEGAKNAHFTKREAHRALDDINGSIEELKWYLTFLK
ncbi:oligoribonuclease [Candidatus Saccharibacteria bacterium]|nr:oligoribonuclease [Candidatus Saccharibacteria bacterium]